MTNFELSQTPSFMAHYIAALFLPHTYLDQFPKLKGRLERTTEDGRRRTEAKPVVIEELRN